MSYDFKALKRNRSNIESLNKAIESTNTNNDPDDATFWQPTVDKMGNGSAIIRFLPVCQKDAEAAAEDATPFVKLFSHGFEDNGGWYIENCPTTIGKECPACDNNSELWNSGIDANKDIVRKRKRRLHYVSNILVMKDSSNPENEGKVFRYKYGKKIFDKIKEAMNPEFEDEVAINPFDLWEGANFKLKIRKVEGYRNYDKSEFESKSALSDDDSRLEEIWKSEYSLLDLVGENKFKDYDDLQKRLVKVLGTSVSGPSLAEDSDLSNVPYFGNSEDVSDDVPPFDVEEDGDTKESAESGDDMDFFQALANSE